VKVEPLFFPGFQQLVNDKRDNQHFYWYESQVPDKEDGQVVLIMKDQVVGSKQYK
jgi:hypothetical protein